MGIINNFGVIIIPNLHVRELSSEQLNNLAMKLARGRTGIWIQVLTGYALDHYTLELDLR